MRLCVLGTSSSSGLGLPNPSQAWPWLAAAELASTLGEEVAVHHAVFMPYGSRAVDYALSKVDASDPDVVVVSLGSYPCAIGTVAERVRRRYGKRAHRLYRRLEQRFEGATANRGTARGQLNRMARKVVRRVIGTETLAGVDEVVGVYNELLHRLAQREGLHVLVLVAPHWPAEVVKENPGADRIFADVRRRVRPVVDEHRYLWTDSQPAYDAAPNRRALYQTDEAHKSEAGHRIQAEEVVKALVGPGGPYAERVQGTGAGRSRLSLEPLP
jgi:lysophospholipase L1-like esterase